MKTTTILSMILLAMLSAPVLADGGNETNTTEAPKATTTEAPKATTTEAPKTASKAAPAEIQVDTQKIDNGNVVIKHVKMPRGGFVAVYDEKKRRLGRVRLERGDHENVKVHLREKVAPGTHLTAMPERGFLHRLGHPNEKKEPTNFDAK